MTMDSPPNIHGAASTQLGFRRINAVEDGHDVDADKMPIRESASAVEPSKAHSVPPRRVLYIVSQFPSLSETFIVREISALIALGIDVRILSLKRPSEDVVQEQAMQLMARVIHPSGLLRTFAIALRTVATRPLPVAGFMRTTISGLWRRPAILLKSLAASLIALGRAKEIDAFSPQLVHATWATYPATAAWLLSRVMGCPFSFTSRAHDIFIEDHMMAGKLEAAALAVTITKHNVRYMERWMPAPGRVQVQVIHSSLNLPEFPYNRTGRPPGKLLSVGRLVPMKGFDVLLSALARLRDRGCIFTCSIIGEGPERERLEALRSTLGLNGVVEFPGAMVQAQVASQMADSTLMVLPCVVAQNGQSDGIPNVLMEAMASGLPVISTRVSGIPELVEDGLSGRLVEAGDVAGLADAIESLLGDSISQDRFARAGRAKVEREFNVEIEAARLLEHFRTACHVP